MTKKNRTSALPDSTSKQLAIAIAALVVLVIGSMFPLLQAGFLSWDDYATVARNPHFDPPGFHTVWHYIKEPYMSLWVPATYAAWTLVASVAHRDKVVEGSALDPVIFHAANLGLHLLTTLVVFFLARRFLKFIWPAFIAAAVFAVHPVQVESVGWVSGFKDLLCATLVLGAVLLAIYSFNSTQRVWLAAIATLAFMLAMLSKPTAVVAPVVLLATLIALGHLNLARHLPHDVLPVTPVESRDRRFAIGMVITWMILAIPCVIWTRAVQRAEHDQKVNTIFERAWVSVDALAFYAKKIAWPLDLCFDYGRTPAVALQQSMISLLLPLTLVTLVLGFLLLVLKSHRRVVVASIVISVVCVSPVLGMVPFDFQQYSTVADHYLYMSMAGVGLLVGTLANRFKFAGVVACVAVAAMSVQTFIQTGVWQDNQTFFTNNIRVNPASWVSYSSLGADFNDKEQFDLGLSFSQKAIQMKPSHGVSWRNLSVALMRTGDRPQAIVAGRRAVELEPMVSETRSNLSALLAESGDLDGALEHAGKAVEFNSTSASAQLNLGTVLAQRGRSNDALIHLSLSVKLSPRDPRALTNRAIVLLQLGKFNAAQADLLRAVQLDPTFEPALQTLQSLRPSR